MKPIVKKQRLYKEIIQSLMEYIEKNNLTHGERLPSERNLAELLAVSRTTVKEAISVLEANGIVHIRQGVGIFLTASNTDQLQKDVNGILENQKGRFLELIELRQSIESDAAYYAAKRITESQKEKLTICYQKLALIEREGGAGIQEDLHFHLAIAEASNNALMIEMMRLISQRVEVFLIQNRPETLEETEQIQQVMNEHQLIYSSIMNGSPEEAKKAMWNHLQSIKVRHKYE